jgi:hypothetical protein
VTARWIPLAERERWTAALEGATVGFAHRPEYSAVTAHANGHAAGLWAWEGPRGRAVCPLLRRAAPGGGFDLATPLGFGGFAIDGDIAGLADDWKRYWHDAGALAAYVQLSPWRTTSGWQALLSGFDGQLRPSRECWMWDLRPEPGDLLSGMHPNHRRFLQQWRAEDVATCDDPAELEPAFDRLYAGFLAGHDVGRDYRFAPTSLAALVAAPGALWLGARGAAGSIEAVVLFLFQGTRADLFLATSSPEGRRHSRGLYWEAARRLRERGVHTLNLGGGIVDGDALAQFKRRFGARSQDTLALRQVFDRDAFARACALARVDAGSDARFPPWLGA